MESRERVGERREKKNMSVGGCGERGEERKGRRG